MRFGVFLLSILIPATVLAQPYEASDLHQKPGFVGVRALDLTPPGGVQQVGEIVVLEGDDDLVTSDGMGGYSIVVSSTYVQPMDITKRFFSGYADEYDEIIVFTTFDDSGTPGAAAYEMSAQQEVQGLGRDIFDYSDQWGADSHKFHAFLNMMNVQNYIGQGQGLADPTNSLYPVLGQEFAHRWLSFLHYKDSTGAISSAMLGRDAAHWASTLQAYASVMDGNQFTEQPGADGFYSIVGYFTHYSPLDLYGMGLVDASQVPPFFVLHNATTSTGKAVDPTKPARGKLTGDREDITIDQIIAADGPRVPAAADSEHSFRVAWVLLTRPGELAGQVVDLAKQLDQGRLVWEARFAAMTGGHGSMCTQVSAPCGSPVARIQGGEVVELGGNGNRVVEPGESVFVDFSLLNDSPAAAHQIVLSSSSPLITSDTTTIDELLPLASTVAGLSGAIPGDAPCGQTITIEAQTVVDGHTFRGFTEVTPGLTTLVKDDFEQSPGLLSAPDQVDQTVNGWAWGAPEGYASMYGYAYQPSGGHASKKAWFTGLAAGHAKMYDSSLAVGTSQLLSQPIDVSKTYLPALRYFAWYEAIDYSNAMQGGQVSTTLALVTEASADGGKSWVEIDRVNGADPLWKERIVPLDGRLALTGKISLRFTVSNDSATTQVEAGIDDLELRSLTQACNPNYQAPPIVTPPGTSPNGCACALGGHEHLPASAIVWLLLLAAAVLRRRLLA